jgi:hypothetical protein
VIFMRATALFISLFVTGPVVMGHDSTTSLRSCHQLQTDEKDSRTQAQKKIDSQLLYAIYQMRGEAEAKGVPTEPIVLRRDSKDRVLVDIRSQVTRKLISRVRRVGGTILSTSQKDHSLIAYVPLNQIEKLAELNEVRFISQPSEAITN